MLGIKNINIFVSPPSASSLFATCLQQPRNDQTQSQSSVQGNTGGGMVISQEAGGRPQLVQCLGGPVVMLTDL